MRLVKLKSLKAGPDGIFQPGQRIAVSDEEATQLVTGGYAEWADPPVKESAAESPPSDDETTVSPSPSRRPAAREQKRKS